jgi:hypothetical protein
VGLGFESQLDHRTKSKTDKSGNQRSSNFVFEDLFILIFPILHISLDTNNKNIKSPAPNFKETGFLSENLYLFTI